jgi:hypothetical protein
MARVPVRLSDHVHQHPQQRHFALVTPPRHMGDRIERQCADVFVCARACTVVETDDLLARLSCSSVELRVGLGVLFESGRKRLTERTPESVAEVPGLDTAQVLDQPEQVGAGRGQRPADVVLRKSVELPEHGLTSATQLAVQTCFCIGSGHAGQSVSGACHIRARTDGKQRYRGIEIIGNAALTQRASPEFMARIKRPPCTDRHLRGTSTRQSS